MSAACGRRTPTTQRSRPTSEYPGTLRSMAWTLTRRPSVLGREGDGDRKQGAAGRSIAPQAARYAELRGFWTSRSREGR